MSQPPSSHIKPETLFAELMKLPRAHRVVDFPIIRDDKPVCQVAIWVLTQAESMAAISAAEAFTRKTLKLSGDIPERDQAQQGYQDIYRNAASVEVLLRAVRSESNLNIPFFKNRDELMMLTNDQIGVLMQHYLVVQEELGPIASKMDEADIQSWIKRLGGGGDVYPFFALSLGAQAELVRHMAYRLYHLPTDKSSSTSHADSELNEQES